MMVDRVFHHRPFLAVVAVVVLVVLEDLEILLLVDPVVKDHPRFMLTDQQIQ
jgi:hypothetical protein